MGLFVVYPLVATGLLSLTDWDGISPDKPFVGLDNYRKLAGDADFRNSMVVTLLYGVGVSVLSVVTGLGAAALLNKAIRGRAVYRTAFFLPVVTSSIAAAAVWKYLFGASGPVNAGLSAVGLGAPNWLGDPHLALLCLTLLTVWKQLGLNTVLYLTAMQTIPTSVYEAAALDGAGPFQTMRRITFPLLAPMTFFVVVQALVATFQGFDLVYQLTSGGPLGGTEVVGFLVYRTAFVTGQFGYGATIAYAGFALVFGLTWVQWRLGGRAEA
ncbi:sugar ABC transporter permease [Knoellia sp. DB2414S]|uniref:Sugar ABC transporter permease n=1 Tax=Knoellia koreensis TaxID=2730921 RepID=A0A849HS44_9MICO|nr:sugar ABC transporter permease [Knoellia sp. DB2414S]